MKEESSVMAFDALYTNNQIQKCKVLLPYISPAMQKHMAIYIKYMELQYTINSFHKHPFQICENRSSSKPDFKKLSKELKPYCSEAELKQLEHMTSILQTMEMYQEMSQTMSTMQELFPDMNNNAADDSSASSAGGISIENLLMGMLSPEQKAMFDVFSNSEQEITKPENSHSV